MEFKVELYSNALRLELLNLTKLMFKNLNENGKENKKLGSWCTMLEFEMRNSNRLFSPTGSTPSKLKKTKPNKTKLYFNTAHWPDKRISVFAVSHTFHVNTLCIGVAALLVLLSEGAEACRLPSRLFFQGLNLVFRHNKLCVWLVSFGPLLAPWGPLTLPYWATLFGSRSV